MLQVLSDNVFLMIFIVIALGAGIGAIPIGGIRFGAAGTLFAGLLIGALVPEPTADLGMLQNLGLGLFVYLVGLESGETFFKELKSQVGLILSAIIAIAAGAAVAIVAGLAFGVSREIIVGIFSGALTNTPSLALAQTQTGSELPAVGYSIAYPVGVITAILIVSLLVGHNWKAKNDQGGGGAAELELARVKIGQPMSVDDLLAKADGNLGIATVSRVGQTRVVDADGDLLPGDVITMWGSKKALPALISEVGARVPRNPFLDRHVRLDQYTVSNRALVGRKIRDLPMYDRFRGSITRIRRVDDMIVATPDTYLEDGDIVEVAHPLGREPQLTAYFGDSTRDVSEVDLIAFAGGLALGFLAALIVIPLPAGASFALGSAAGPLIVGLILGALRTGPLGTSWKLPRTANFTLRQFGLMLFLAAVGIASGPAFASTAFSMTGLISLIIAAMVTAATVLLFYLLAFFQGQSTARATGGAAGLLGQPAVLQFALSRKNDTRIMTGYSTVITVAVLFKIIVVPLMLAII